MTTKIRSSLVLKLNLEMMKRLLFGFLSINILVFLMSFFVILWGVEVDIQEAVENLDDSLLQSDIISFNFKDYRVEKESSPQGFLLPKGIQEYLPLGIKDARRNIFIGESGSDLAWRDRLETISYSVSFSRDSSFYKVTFPIGKEVKVLLNLFTVLLVTEGIILLRNIRKGQRVIRRSLKPLYDLAITARNLNVQSFDGENLKDLAGEISNIDASKLDRRISVDSSQTELKALAAAINEMLNRINSSYQSQVRFVSDASHELRTPISVIQGYINLLDRWGKEDKKTLQESIDAIKSEVEGMKELVEKLLFLARGDSETIQLQKDLFDACEIVDEIIKETQMIDQGHRFETNLSIPAYVEADRQLFKQAIRILVDNSIKYTPVGKLIILKVIKDEGKVHIIVQDQGVGIDAEDLPNIFDRFYRSDKSRARKSGGTGLGLAIAKWIIERHGAYFEILSRVDIGTRITIVFPEGERL